MNFADQRPLTEQDMMNEHRRRSLAGDFQGAMVFAAHAVALRNFRRKSSKAG